MHSTQVPGAKQKDISNFEDVRETMRLTDNDPVIPVIPTHGKRECRVDETLSELDVTTRDW